MKRPVCSGLLPFFSGLMGLRPTWKNKGTLETAQKIAGHESPRATKLYDRTDDQLPLDEIEKISG